MCVHIYLFKRYLKKIINFKFIYRLGLGTPGIKPGGFGLIG